MGTGRHTAVTRSERVEGPFLLRECHQQPCDRSAAPPNEQLGLVPAAVDSFPNGK